MYNKFILILSMLILLSGCTRIDASNTDYNEIVNNVFEKNNTFLNSASVGYEYYLPRGLKLIEDRDFNQIFMYDDTYMYLYVDVVSYYYKNKLNLIDESSDSYFYSNIGDNGFILIEDKDNKYYIKIVYNYAKIEAYTDKIDLNKVITYSCIILNSISYNDVTIGAILNDSNVSSSEKNYVVEGPNNNIEFSIEEYVNDKDDDLEKELLPED